MHDVMVCSKRFQPIRVEYWYHMTTHTTKDGCPHDRVGFVKTRIVGDKSGRISPIFDGLMSWNLLTCNMECLLHVSGVDDSNVIPFTEKSWNKTKACASEWRNLDGHDGDLARSREEEFWDSQQPPASHGYHRNCYARFTNITNVARAKKRLEKRANEAASVADDPGLDVDQPPKRRRSQRAADSGSFSAGSRTTLPRSCIICKSKTHHVTLRTGKRATDKLCLAETVDGGEYCIVICKLKLICYC